MIRWGMNLTGETVKHKRYSSDAVLGTHSTVPNTVSSAVCMEYNIIAPQLRIPTAHKMCLAETCAISMVSCAKMLQHA